MRITSFNANGLRSATDKGFFDWFQAQGIDLLCVQETKARVEQLQDARMCPSGYQRFFHDARSKRGYSGVALFAKQAPDSVRDTLGWAPFDDEGRYIEARFGALSVVSLYLPSGSSGELRQGFKFQVLDWLAPILAEWLVSGRDYVLCGDWNIVHTEQDIRNWKSNQKNSGCLPEERAWLDGLLAQGWVDAYRRLRPQGQEYTWWSQRGAARAKDIGWRIDYQLVSPGLAQRLGDCAICPRELRFSDHAPFTVDYDRGFRG
jgi:exodeoxyribonuclease-3